MGGLWQLDGDVDGIGDAADVLAIDEVRLEEALLHLQLATLRLYKVDEFVRNDGVEVNRCVWTEFEGVILDLNLATESLCARLELALADVAPWALHVRPDVRFNCVAHAEN